MAARLRVAGSPGINRGWRYSGSASLIILITPSYTVTYHQVTAHDSLVASSIANGNPPDPCLNSAMQTVTVPSGRLRQYAACRSMVDSANDDGSRPFSPLRLPDIPRPDLYIYLLSTGAVRDLNTWHVAETPNGLPMSRPLLNHLRWGPGTQFWCAGGCFLLLGCFSYMAPRDRYGVADSRRRVAERMDRVVGLRIRFSAIHCNCSMQTCSFPIRERWPIQNH